MSQLAYYGFETITHKEKTGCKTSFKQLLRGRQALFHFPGFINLVQRKKSFKEERKKLVTWQATDTTSLDKTIEKKSIFYADPPTNFGGVYYKDQILLKPTKNGQFAENVTMIVNSNLETKIRIRIERQNLTEILLKG